MRGLLERGLFTKLDDKDIYASISILLPHILQSGGLFEILAQRGEAY